MEYEIFDSQQPENGEKEAKTDVKKPLKKVKWERRDLDEFGFVKPDAVQVDTGGFNFLNTKKRRKNV